MAKKKDFTTSINELLPDGLDESTLEKIAGLIAKKIDEEVKLNISNLTNKVTSFIRGNIEKLKEQAVKELELENETFRNAKLFETVRSMFSLETTGEDEINGMTALAEISENQEQKIEVLATEVDKLLKENIRLKKAGKVLADRNSLLEEDVALLQESVESVEKNQARRLSDRAVVVSNENFNLTETAQPKQEKARVYQNEWLNENILTASKRLIRG